MLRIRILASTIPLLLAGLFAGGGLSTGTHPCLILGDGPLQIAATPWQAGFHVGFTDDPARATARVQIVDQPETGDFTVTDDADTAEPAACAAAPARMIGIAASADRADAIIYLSRDAGADYRIFVRSKTVTAREAAALVVAAGAPAHAVTAALAGGS
jgi:hypothetical protein